MQSVGLYQTIPPMSNGVRNSASSNRLGVSVPLAQDGFYKAGAGNSVNVIQLRQQPLAHDPEFGLKLPTRNQALGWGGAGSFILLMLYMGISSLLNPTPSPTLTPQPTAIVQAADAQSFAATDFSTAAAPGFQNYLNPTTNTNYQYKFIDNDTLEFRALPGQTWWGTVYSADQLFGNLQVPNYDAAVARVQQRNNATAFPTDERLLRVTRDDLMGP